MIAVLAFLAGAALTAAAIWLANRQPPTDWLTDVEPVVAPAEPWPGYTPGVTERRAHWRPGTDAYDAENVIRKTWGEQHEH